MGSLWKDLLYLQGYLIRRDALQWRPDVRPRPAPAPKAADAAATPRRPATNDDKAECA